MSQAQPQWSEAKPSFAKDGTHTVGSAPGAAVAPSASAAKAADMAQLGNATVDIKRWINNAVRRQVEELKAQQASTSSTSSGDATIPNNSTTSAGARASLEEQAVTRLFSKMQAHAQQVGSSVEEHISQAVVRLPRTTMELQRMIAEANELSVQLQATRDVVKPVVEAREQGQAQRLNEIRDTQARLKHCQAILAKALAVDSSTAKIAQAIQQLQSEQHRGGVGTSTANSIGPSSSSTSTVNVAELSMSIRAVKRDLQELQAVDAAFGEKHRLALEQHEQVIEEVLEQECLSYLGSHDATRAAELLRPLSVIGRADAVLQGYANAVTADCTRVIQETLGSGGSPQDASAYGGVPAKPISAALAARALEETVVPVIRATMESELNFLFLLSECMGANFSMGSDGSGEREGGSGTGGGPSDVARGTNQAPALSETTTAMSSGTSAAHSKDGHLPTVMRSIIDNISGAFQAAMGPVLEAVTQNSDLIACYNAIRTVKVSAASLTSTAPGPADGASVTLAEGRPEQTSLDAVGDSSSTKTARLGVRERATAQASAQALNALVAIFHRESVLEAFCQRIATRTATAVGSTSDSNTGTAKRAASLSNVPLLLYLQNDHVQGELTAALLDGVRDVLHFFPELTLPKCVPRWSQTLSSLFQGLFPATTTAKSSGASAPRSSTAMALVKLALITKCAKPALEATQKEVEAFLSSADIQQDYPSSANATAQALVGGVWSPLTARLDAAVLEAQQVAKESILNGILATVARYAEMPVWGRQQKLGDGNGAGASEAPGAGHNGGKAPPLVGYQQGHVTPSEAVREFGEALMGAPLALESLREEVASVEGLLTGFFLSAASAPAGTRASGHVSSSLCATVKNGVEDLLDDKAAPWLDDIVRAAIDSFVEETVYRLRVDFSPAPNAPADADALKKVATAWEQLAADLDYVRNVLSAVSEEQYEVLENCVEAIQALPQPPTGTAPCVVGDVLKEAQRDK